jgi:hypothetical protein
MCRCNCKYEDTHGNCKIKYGMLPCEEEIIEEEEDENNTVSREESNFDRRWK